jgi:hypothetical protein
MVIFTHMPFFSREKSFQYPKDRTPMGTRAGLEDMEK